MAVKKITTVFQFRRDTEANWLLNKDVIPAAGEPCFVLDKNILKIGDGTTTFENLEPVNGAKFEIAADGKSIVLEDNVLKLMGFDGADVGAQPRKGADGNIEWVIPSTEAFDNLKKEVTTLQTTVTEIREIVMPSEEGVGTLLDRVESLETEVNTIIAGLTDDGKVNTMIELIEYVESHGKEAADMASDIKTLQDLVGNTSVNDQIMSIVAASEKKAETLYERVKYEVADIPAGTLVDHRDKEIRIMVPADAKFVKQAVGENGNANMYYMTFKAYAPTGAVSFKEGDRGVIINQMHTFDGPASGVDQFGRKYSVCWLALASYDEGTNTWTYFGKNSSANKYIGWDYVVEWYDADGIVISADHIRINLSNEACHDIVEPYYMSKFVKGVAVNGTLLDMVDGQVNIPVGAGLKTSKEIVVAEDGTMSIGTISFDKIEQDPDTVVVMDGGSAV